jgi:hypothetical protein
MPAIANAVFDAVGVRIDEVPITPEKIVKALEAKAAGKPARYGPTDFPAVRWPDPNDVPPPWEGGDGQARKLEAESEKLKGKSQKDREGQTTKQQGPEVVPS